MLLELLCQQGFAAFENVFGLCFDLRLNLKLFFLIVERLYISGVEEFHDICEFPNVRGVGTEHLSHVIEIGIEDVDQKLTRISICFGHSFPHNLLQLLCLHWLEVDLEEHVLGE
jgi:hypothetical protein